MTNNQPNEQPTKPGKEDQLIKRFSFPEPPASLPKGPIPPPPPGADKKPDTSGGDKK